MSLVEFLKQERIGCFINGEFLKNGTQVPFTSPVTQQRWKTFLHGDKKLAQKAIEVAQTTLQIWKLVPGPEKARILHKCGDMMLEHGEALAQVMTMETGKPIAEGLSEVNYTAAYFHWFAGEAERIYGITIPATRPDKKLMVIYEPIGVAGLITPWNFPLAMPGRKIAAALAAGCTAVIKPASESPLSALAIAFLLQKAGLPAGAFNVIHGPEKEIGEALLESPLVRKLTFTGSTEVGKYLYTRSGDTLKKLTLELGGNAPVIIFNRADLDKAVNGVGIAKYRNNGQSCVAANRILVQKEIYAKFVARFVEKVKSLTVGDPLDPNTNISLVLHPASLAKTKRHIEDAITKGAKVEWKGSSDAHPTVLSGVTPEMLIFSEENFGPVAAIIPFETFDEGIALANNTQFGLASYVFTEDLSEAHFAVAQLEFGIIGVNDGLPSTPQGSFGGIKSSGFGREGGPMGIYEYLAEKFVSIRL